MYNIPEILKEYSLNPSNSIVIGSGILNALKIRESNDVDIVVKQETYNRLLKLSEFKIKNVSGLDFLSTKTLEIATVWNVKNHIYTFEELLRNSVVIDKVRYITPEFLLSIKKEWLREKDKKDIKLIEEYLQHH